MIARQRRSMIAQEAWGWDAQHGRAGAAGAVAHKSCTLCRYGRVYIYTRFRILHSSIALRGSNPLVSCIGILYTSIVYIVSRVCSSYELYTHTVNVIGILCMHDREGRSCWHGKWFNDNER